MVSHQPYERSIVISPILQTGTLSPEMEFAFFHAAGEWQSSLTFTVKLYCLVHSHV